MPLLSGLDQVVFQLVEFIAAYLRVNQIDTLEPQRDAVWQSAGEGLIGAGCRGDKHDSISGQDRAIINDPASPQALLAASRIVGIGLYISVIYSALTPTLDPRAL